MIQFRGPGGGAIFGPDARIFREEIEPLFRERLNGLPKIQLRSPMRYKTLAPSKERRIFKADAGDVYLDAEDLGDYQDAEDAFMLEMDADLRIREGNEPVSEK